MLAASQLKHMNAQQKFALAVHKNFLDADHKSSSIKGPDADRSQQAAPAMEGMS